MTFEFLTENALLILGIISAYSVSLSIIITTILYIWLEKIKQKKQNDESTKSVQSTTQPPR